MIETILGLVVGIVLLLVEARVNPKEEVSKDINCTHYHYNKEK